MALLLVVALAAPASAATWRNYGSVRADSGWYTMASGSANNTSQIQVGIYTYGRARTVEYDWDWFCEKGGNFKSNSKYGLKTTTQARTWKWVTIRNATYGGWDCDFTASAHPPAGAHRLKVRVR
jgi:hypothetical protein